MKIPRKLAAFLTAAAFVAVASGCSAQTTKPAADVSDADFETAMTTPTKLTFWSWLPNIQQQVDLFEKKYPAIDVEVVNAGGGATGHYQKLRTAISSKTGAPDVAQLEYPYISSFDLTGALLDLAPYGGNKLKDQYEPWLWNLVSSGDRVLAVPQDTGPVGYLYRDDLLSASGIKPPATWDEFSTAATTYAAANPGKYLTNLSTNDASEFLSLLWQNGVKPFDFDGKETVSIDLTSPEATKVADYWTKLLESGSISNEAAWTDGWYQSFANGRFASWMVAAWGPLKLQGPASDTSGMWRATQMPQWDESKPAAGNWGGSAVAALKTTKNPIVAAEFARFITADKSAALLAANEQSLFPASKEILADPDFVSTKSEFFGGQEVNAEFAKISETVDDGFVWLPFADYVFSSYKETVGTAIANRSDLSAALAEWESSLKTYATQQGFTVK
ncbi:ABC transporter substrate-binding protein [Microbacterium foliorum]|uniref:ABC transporter substrate-binding protein n=1 Tax=Microbacterium foliorum TaxID=104336 RepID=UPI00099FF9E6|nr:extracellular solute-binding protein [Microbacterium foliorum]AQY02366.1 ABC transporter substrate-binding protein [Microbacterium foliorum]